MNTLNKSLLKVALTSLLLLSGCMELTADKPQMTNSPSTYVTFLNQTVTLSVKIPSTEEANGNCRLSGSKEGILGQWPVGSSEFTDTRIVRLTQASQSYTLKCDNVDRGVDTRNITVQVFPTLPAANPGTCNVLCVNGGLTAANAACGLASNTYCAGASCVNGFTGTATEACVPIN